MRRVGKSCSTFTVLGETIHVPLQLLGTMHPAKGKGQEQWASSHLGLHDGRLTVFGRDTSWSFPRTLQQAETIASRVAKHKQLKANGASDEQIDAALGIRDRILNLIQDNKHTEKHQNTARDLRQGSLLCKIQRPTIFGRVIINISKDIFDKWQGNVFLRLDKAGGLRTSSTGAAAAPSAAGDETRVQSTRKVAKRRSSN